MFLTSKSPSACSPKLWEEVVSQEVPSWNQILECLQELETLGRVFRRCS